MDGGITISTTQGIGAVVFLVGTIGTLLQIIRSSYLDRINDCNETIEKLERRIERMEERDARRSDLISHNQEVLERAVDLLERQASVAETALRTRRRGTGAD